MWGFLLNRNTQQRPSGIEEHFTTREQHPGVQHRVIFSRRRVCTTLFSGLTVTSGNLHRSLYFCTLSLLETFPIMAAIYLDKMTL